MCSGTWTRNCAVADPALPFSSTTRNTAFCNVGRRGRRGLVCPEVLHPLAIRDPPDHARSLEQLLYKNMQRFRGGLVFKAHRRLYHSTLGLRVIKKKKHGRQLEFQRSDKCPMRPGSLPSKVDGTEPRPARVNLGIARQSTVRCGRWSCCKFDTNWT